MTIARARIHWLQQLRGVQCNSNHFMLIKLNWPHSFTRLVSRRFLIRLVSLLFHSFWSLFTIWFSSRYLMDGERDEYVWAHILCPWTRLPQLENVVVCNSKVIWAISLYAKRSIRLHRIAWCYMFLQVKVKYGWYFFRRWNRSFISLPIHSRRLLLFQLAVQIGHFEYIH